MKGYDDHRTSARRRGHGHAREGEQAVDRARAAGTAQRDGELLRAVADHIDPATDSLSDVLDAMRAAVPGLRASLGADGVVSLSADVNLRLDGDTTGLLAVLGLDGATATALRARWPARGGR